MKKVLFALAAGAMLFAGCTKGLEERVSVLEDKVASLEEAVAALDREMDGISAIVSNLQNKVYVTGVTPKTDISGNVVGYTISFTEGEPITITNGQTGPQGPKGDAGFTPTIDMFNGEWYWKYEGGDWILDSAGNKIPAARQLDFEIGADGHLYVTVQGGGRIDLGDVTGEDGQAGAPGAPGENGAPGAQGDSWFDGVTVDETAGTVTISIKDSEHDLVFPLYQFTFKVTVPENATAFVGSTITLNYSVCEVAAATTVVRAYPSRGLEAVVDSKTNTIAVTLGMEAGYVDVYAINNATGEIKAQSVEIAAGEKLQANVTETELVLAPDGTGSVEIPVSTVVDYVVEVPSWATSQVAPAVKAVSDEVVTVKPAGENVTANDYTGYVVIKDKETSAELFKVALVQKNYLPSLVADAEGETIQWEESFDLYRYESDITSGEPKASIKNVFTVALSDDFSKGVYKISNMFKADMYYNQGQMISNKGGEYYADVEGNVLTIKYKGSTLSYGFSKDIDLVYDAEAQTITSAAPIATYAYGGVLANRDCFVVNYSVAVKVEAPVQEGSIAGTWDQVASVGGSAANSTVTIAVDGTTVTLTDFLYAGVTVTGTLNGDTVTIPAYTMISDSTGPIMADLVLTISADKKTITAPDFNIGGWIDVTGYTATKQGGDDAESSFDVTAICGEYWETFSGYWPTPGTTIIEVSDDPNYDVKITFFKPTYGSTYDVAYGTVNADGTVITIAAFTSNMFGPCSSFDITVDGTNLSGNYAGALAYTAMKK